MGLEGPGVEAAAAASRPWLTRGTPPFPKGGNPDKLQLVWSMPGKAGHPNEQTAKRLRQSSRAWDRWLENRELPRPTQRDPRLAADDAHPSIAEDPHYTRAKAAERFVRFVPEQEAEASSSRGPAASSSRGCRQRSQSAHRGPPTKARPNAPPFRVQGRPAASAAPHRGGPPVPKARPRSPVPKARPRSRSTAAAARDHGRADGNVRRLPCNDRRTSSESYSDYSYESGSDSGPREPPAGGQRRAQPAAAAAGRGGHRGAHAQQADHDRPYSPRDGTRAMVFARYAPVGASAPYLEVPELIRRNVDPELRGQYI